MEEAKNIYRLIVGNAKNTRWDKVVQLVYKIDELDKQSIQACNKAWTLPYNDAKYLIDYAKRSIAIKIALIKISGDYVSLYYVS